MKNEHSLKQQSLFEPEWHFRMTFILFIFSIFLILLPQVANGGFITRAPLSPMERPLEPMVNLLRCVDNRRDPAQGAQSHPATLLSGYLL